MPSGLFAAKTRLSAWLFLGQSLVTALCVTWPAVLSDKHTTLGSPFGDHIKHLWNLWWIRQSSATDPGFPLHTGLINAPVGLPFWPIEPLHGIAALAMPWLSIEQLSDTMAVANLVLIGVFTCFLVQGITRSLWAALGAGFLFQVSSFPAFAIEVGVGELQHTWLLSLNALCLWRLWRRPSRRQAILAGLVLGVTPLVSFYLGLFAAGVAVCLTVGWWFFGFGIRPDIRAFGLAAVIALVLAWIPVHTFAGTYGVSPESTPSAKEVLWDGVEDARVVNPPETRLDAIELLSGERARLQRDPTSRTYGTGRLIGLPTLVLALLAFLRRPEESLPWLVLALGGAVLAMGSYLCVGGEEFLVGSHRVALPFLALNRTLALVAEPLHFPSRFLVLTQLSLAVLSGIALSTLSGKASYLAIPLILLQFVDVRARSALPMPLSTTTRPDLDGLALLKDHQGHAILDLSMLWQSGTRNRRMALFSQMVHNHPVNTIALERIDQFASDGVNAACVLDLAKGLHAAFAEMPVSVDSDLDPSPDLYFLSKQGFTELALSLPAGSAPERLTELLGPPVATSPSAVVWEIKLAGEPLEPADWDERYANRLAQIEVEGCLFTGGDVMGPTGRQDTSVEAKTEPEAPPQMAPVDPLELEPLPLPLQLPMVARTRQAPVSLVDSAGKLVFILDALAVEVQVREINDAAALIVCSECREPMEGWIPRNQLLSEVADPDRTEDRLALFLHLESESNATLRSGVVPNGAVWISPPWGLDADHKGPVYTIRESGSSFLLGTAEDTEGLPHSEAGSTEAR
jgi:hypothetical protein